MVLLSILIVILPTSHFAVVSSHFAVVSPVNKMKCGYIFKGNMRIVDTQENISPKTESGKEFICFLCNFCWHQMLISILSNDLSLSSIVLYKADEWRMYNMHTRECKFKLLLVNLHQEGNCGIIPRRTTKIQYCASQHLHIFKAISSGLEKRCNEFGFFGNITQTSVFPETSVNQRSLVHQIALRL